MFLKHFQLIAKFTCSKFDPNQNVFLCSKHLNLKNEESLFFQTFISLPNVHHSFLKLERILTLIIRRAKGLEIMNYFL
jgi:hypothetical protein